MKKQKKKVVKVPAAQKPVDRTNPYPIAETDPSLEDLQDHPDLPTVNPASPPAPDPPVPNRAWTEM